MNLQQVMAFLKRKEETAGTFARPHWRNALKEIGYARSMEVEDRVARPANRPVSKEAMERAMRKSRSK